MSIESDIGKSVSELVSFIKDKISLNLSESRNNDTISVDEETFIRILNVIDLSVSQGFTTGYSNVESALKNALNNK